MADGYARVSGRLGVARVHQGPGLTNAITGLTEAAKSRTPLIAARRRHARRRSCARTSGSTRTRSSSPSARWPSGCTGRRPRSPTSTRAVRRARGRAARGRADAAARRAGRRGRADRPAAAARARRRCGRRRLRAVVATLLARAERPAIIARPRRGAVRRGPGAAALGELTGAVLATSAVANGLFAGDPFAVGISGGFASPTAQRLLAEADVVIAFGAALNVWTTRHGALIGRTRRSSRSTATRRRSARTGRSTSASSATRRETAEALIAALDGARARSDLGARGAASRSRRRSPPARWRDEPYEASRDWLDPRTLSDRARRAAAAPSGPWSSTPARSWATRRCTCACPDAAGLRLPAGVPVRRARRSATRSARRSRGPTG